MNTIATPPGTAGYASETRVFMVDDGERHWIAANNKEQALGFLAVDCYGYELVEKWLAEMGPVKVEMLGPLEVISVKLEDPDIVPSPSFGPFCPVEKIDRIRKTAREWAASEFGVFASTTY